jgi:hypothetical protein
MIEEEWETGFNTLCEENRDSKNWREFSRSFKPVA